MHSHLLSSFILLSFTILSCSARPWTPGYVKYGKDNFMYLSPTKFWNNGENREPNCDELRAMWRFSMIKSRKTEITNEIPTYRDPFAYNIWESHARSKHLVNGHLQEAGPRGNHIYGKVIHSIPAEKYSEKPRMNGRSFESMAKFFTSDKAITPRGKNAEAFRLPNGEVTFQKLPALSDSFSRLKAVVRAQRAKEIHEKHLAEQSLSRGILKNVDTRGPRPSFEYLYYGNNSLSGKRNPRLSKSFHFISNPSSFIHGPSKYYDPFFAGHYITDRGYYYRTPVVPMNVRYSFLPVSRPSHY